MSHANDANMVVVAAERVIFLGLLQMVQGYIIMAVMSFILQPLKSTSYILASDLRDNIHT